MSNRALPPPPDAAQRSDPAVWAAWMQTALRDQPRRWAHVRSVWRRASELAEAATSDLSDGDRSDLVLAALLHDIGRALDPDDSEPHALVGAHYLDDVGLPRIARLVAHHSGACAEAYERGHGAGCQWTRDGSDLADVLTYLDMTTGPDGQEMSPLERRADIAARYGVDSFQVKAFDSISDEIERGAEVANRWR